MVGKDLVSYYVIRIKINDGDGGFRKLSDWFLELDLSQMVFELEIFDDRVMKVEPGWEIHEAKQTSFIKFKPNPEKLPSTDAGIFTFEIKTKTKGQIILTSAYFCGTY